MVASYTDRLRITKQGDNDNPNTWGDVLNGQVFELMEEAIAGVIEVDMTGASSVNIATTVNNGASDVARNAVLELTGVIGASIDLIVPSVEKTYLVRCAHTGGVINIKPSGGAGGIEVSNGDAVVLYVSGTEIYEIARKFINPGFLEVSLNLADIDSAPDTRDNLGLGDMALETVAGFTATILGAIYPIGSIYTNATVATNPATLLGFGTWEEYAAGRVLIGVGTGTDENAVEEIFTLGLTGGEYEHTLTVAEMPEHVHGMGTNLGFNDNSTLLTSRQTGAPIPTIIDTYPEGGDGAHNNIQPYVTVHMWKRTA
jgi:hypothetical protein